MGFSRARSDHAATQGLTLCAPVRVASQKHTTSQSDVIKVVLAACGLWVATSQSAGLESF